MKFFRPHVRIGIFAYGISRNRLARDASTKRSADPRKVLDKKTI